jgi:hypothetical protein
VKADLIATLEDLNISYVDSFVIHWPQACPSVATDALVRKAYTAPAAEKTMFPLDEEGRCVVLRVVGCVCVCVCVRACVCVCVCVWCLNR